MSNEAPRALARGFPKRNTQAERSISSLKAAVLRPRMYKSNSFNKARNYCFLLLKFRLRSEKEMRERLNRKKFDNRVIDEVVKFLKERSFIDDNVFAKSWIESRLKKPLGIRRLKQELKAKGIDRSIIEESAQELTKGYSELEIVERIAKQRIDKLKKIEPQKARIRLYGYLLRRGFAPEIISDCLSQVCEHIS